MVIVVEGKNDYNKIKSIYPNSEILITNGSAVSNEIITMIEKLSLTDQVILCLDPDGAGEKIRSIISNQVTNVYHLFANKALAISKNKKKVGIEHMRVEDIKALFANVKFNHIGSDVTFQDLIDLGLTGKIDSKQKRQKLGNYLGIGACNAKQLLKRINMFGITLKEIRNLYDS